MYSGRRRSVLAVWVWATIWLTSGVTAQDRERRAPPDSVRREPVVAQHPDYVLEPIVVVGARERSTAPPVATIEVEPREIHRTVHRNPYDLIRRVTGLEVHDQGQGPGFASNVVLRGFTADHSSDLLLVIDGVPVNLPVHGHVEGYADWNYMLPGAVGSLRVIHGPSSPLYGDFSIAGTMEVYTQADADGTSGQVSGNAFGDVSTWATTGFRREGGGALAGLELRRNEGWRRNSGLNSANVLVRGWRGAGDGRLEGGLALYGADWRSPGFLSMSEFEAGDLEQEANRTDGGDQRRAVLHGRYAGPVGGSQFLQVIGWSVLSDWALSLTVPGHTDALGNLYQTTETDQRFSVGGQVEYTWLPQVGELTLGVSGRTDRSRYDLGRSLRRVPIEEQIALDAGHVSVSTYTRWRWHPFERLGLDLGARVDHLRNRSYNRLGLSSASRRSPGWQLSVLAAPTAADGLELPPAYNHVVGGGGPVGEWVGGHQTVVGPKVGAELRLSDSWSLMASSSRGFRSAVGVVGDPYRKPVTSWANEVGLDLDRPGFGAHLSFFRSDVHNERIQDPITLEIASTGSSVRQGVEAMTEVGLWEDATLYARGTLTDAVLSGRYADAHDDHDQAGGSATGDESAKQDVPGIARYMAQAALESPLFDRLSGRVEWRITGPYVPIGEPDVKTDPYATFDAGLSYPIRDSMTLDLEVRNVLDRVYPEMRSSGYVSPGSPRTIGLTLQLLEPVR